MAEIWTRLAFKNPVLALQIVELWRHSELRLMRRLALFAAANAVVLPSTVAEMIMALPRGELFVTNSSVEVYRLLHQRWRDLTPKQRQTRSRGRIAEGPPSDWFREGAEIERIIDRCRFDFLGELQRAGLELTAKSKTLLQRDRRTLAPVATASFRASWLPYLAPRRQRNCRRSRETQRRERMTSLSRQRKKQPPKPISWRAMHGRLSARATLRAPFAALRLRRASSFGRVLPGTAFCGPHKKSKDPERMAKIAQLLLERTQQAVR